MKPKMTAAEPATGRARRFFGGFGVLTRGLGMWVTSPRLMFIGAIPALIVGAVYATGLVIFITNIDSIAAWLTPFASDWDAPFRIGMRFVAGAAATGLVALAAIFTFTIVTLAVGDPFYERIWREVEKNAGGAPADEAGAGWRSLLRGVGNGIRLFAVTALIGLALFVCGFIPVVGQIAAPILAVIFGGWFLAVELAGFAFDARGLSLRERRRMLARNRAGTLGFGVATYLLFLVPLGAVVVMPAAVAGATMLSRDALNGHNV